MSRTIDIALEHGGETVEKFEQIFNFSLISVPILALLTILVCILCFAAKGRCEKENCANVKEYRIFSPRNIAIAAFSVYIVLLVKATVLPHFTLFRADPFVYEKDTLVIYIGTDLSEVNLIPFKSLIEQFGHSLIYGAFQTLSNIALLMPYAYLSRLLFKSFTTKKTVIVGLLISCAIEMIQFFEPRSMDIDDVILNMIGVVLGCILFDKTKRWLTEKHFYESAEPACSSQGASVAKKPALFGSEG